MNANEPSGEKFDARAELLALELRKEALLEYAEYSEAAAEAEIPEYVETWRQKLLTLTRREARKTALFRYAGRLAACIAAILIGTMALSVATGIRVDAVIHKAIALLFTETATYDEISTITGDADALAREEGQGALLPTYLPEGYALSIREVHAGLTLMIYKNGRQNLIRIEEILGENGKAMLDNEGTGRGQTTVNGETAFWTENEGGISLYWPRGESSVTVFSDGETLETLVRIAESMRMHP